MMTTTAAPAGGAGVAWPQREPSAADNTSPDPDTTTTGEIASPTTAPGDWVPPLDPRVAAQVQAALDALARMQTASPSEAALTSYHNALAGMLAETPPAVAPADILQTTADEPPTSGAVTPQADPTDLAIVDLLAFDPDLQAMSDQFGGDVGAHALPATELAQRILTLYGPERAGSLYRLAHASAQVRQAYCDALDQALRQSPFPPGVGSASEVGQFSALGHATPEPGAPPWWQLAHHGRLRDEQHTTAHFDTAAFTAWYAAQDTPASRAFASLYGPELTTTTRQHHGPEGDTWVETHVLVGAGRFELTLGRRETIVNDRTRWVSSQLRTPQVAAGHLAVVDLARPPDLYDPTLVMFDPSMGFVTPGENIRPDEDFLDQALPIVAAIAAAWFAGPLGQAAFGHTLAGAAVAGAAATAAGSLVATGSIHLKDVLRSALTSLVTAGVSELTGLDRLGYQLDDAGQVVVRNGQPVVASYTLRALAVTGSGSVKGLLTELAGGRFTQGFTAGLAEGLAGELVREFNTHIALKLQSGAIDLAQASAWQTLARAVGAAVRVAGTPGDPAAAVAAELLQVLGEAIGDDIALARDAVPPSAPFVTALVFDDQGELMPGVVDTEQPWDVQMTQLAGALVDQGLSAEQAWSRAQAHYREESEFQSWYIDAQPQPVLLADASGTLPTVRDARDVIERIESRIATGGLVGGEVSQAIGEAYAAYLELQAVAVAQPEAPTVAQERAATRLVGLISDLGHLARDQGLELTADQQTLIRLARGYETQRLVPEIYGASAGGGILAVGRARSRTEWAAGPNDLDFRGTGHGLTAALDRAFQLTGHPRSEFVVTRWARDVNGKSFPVEWRHPTGGAEVNVDRGHENAGPPVPHVGFQTDGKRRNGGAVRGHILLDEVPYHRE